MGAIQNALNQAAGAALASAGTMALAKGAQAAESQANFNAEMNAAELPEREAKLALEASEAERTKKLGEAEVEKINSIENADKVYKKIVSGIEEKQGFITDAQQARYENRRDKRYNDARELERGKAFNINNDYDKAKAVLSTNIAAAQVETKKAQIELIRKRVQQLGGKK